RNPANPSARFYSSETERAGRVLGLTMRTFDAQSPGNLEAAFAAMVEWRAEGMATLNDGMFYSQHERVVTLARENRLAGVHPETVFAESGGLISYGPRIPDLFLRARTYVETAWKVAERAGLPREQATQCELGAI